MSSVFLVAALISIALVVRVLRTRARFRLAQGCLWLAYFFVVLALKASWVPANFVTFPAMVAFLIYVVIQSMRISKDHAGTASG